MTYRINQNCIISVGFTLTSHQTLCAVEATNDFLSSLPPMLFHRIDFKTTGAMIGAIFCSALVDCLGATVIVNPIEKGHPDIIPASACDATEEVLRNYPQGLEIKGTIGQVDAASKLRAGVRRIEYLSGMTWQAHHQEVNNLMGFIWDFSGDTQQFGYPVITGVFYSNTLLASDWGQVSGTTGRNTKVSGMAKSGKIKMGQSWVLVIDDERYARKFRHFLASDGIGK